MATGMDLIEAIQAERADPPPGIKTLALDGTHRWVSRLEPGHVEMSWTVQGAYFNLEGAVICSWIVALADQALFFAGQTLCGEGEGTRMAGLTLDHMRNISGGEIAIVATIDERVGDRLHGRCEVRCDDGGLGARVSAVIDVIH